MRKLFAVLGCMCAVSACDKHDPILPGVRTSVFNHANIKVENKNITDIPTNEIVFNNDNCPYTQDNANVIRNGDKKLFSGFPTKNTVAADKKPICSGKYIYAGLTTGEVVKINTINRNIVWIADVFRPSNMTGGAPVVDIIAPIVPVKNAIFAGGLGDAFCKINATSGVKQWCVNIGVAVPFVITENYSFVVATDDNLYAIANKDGAVYWNTPVQQQAKPTLDGKYIVVGREKVEIATGNIAE